MGAFSLRGARRCPPLHQRSLNTPPNPSPPFKTPYAAQVDLFHIQCADLGPLTELRIGHDGAGFSSDWHLDNVAIVNTTTNEGAVFSHHNWLNQKKGTSVSLKPDVEVPPDALGPPCDFYITIYTSNLKCARV